MILFILILCSYDLDYLGDLFGAHMMVLMIWVIIYGLGPGGVFWRFAVFKVGVTKILLLVQLLIPCESSAFRCISLNLFLLIISMIIGQSK